MKAEKSKKDIQKSLVQMMFEVMSPAKTSDNPTEELRDYWKYATSPEVKEFYSTEKTGKWCIFVNPKSIDKAWKAVKLSCAQGKLLVAKCSTAKSSGTPKYPKYIICVYNEDWQDIAEIQRVRDTLREIGFTKPLKYKRDIETINGIYGVGEYFIEE